MSALRVILPIVLGIVAAVLNFLVLRGSTAPLELIAIHTDIPADTKISEDMLERLSVRADKAIFKSAVPYSDRGLVLGRRVTRPIAAGEVLLYADLHKLEEENIRLYLKPGETTLTIPLKSSAIAPGLQRGDLIGLRVAARLGLDAKKTALPTPLVTSRILGPFRLLSLGAPVDPSRAAAFGEARLLLVAVKLGPDGQLDPMVSALQEVLAGSFSGNGKENGVLSVEYFQTAK